MTEVPDARLLEQFARNHSEEAFAALVQRYIALVHSVALRHTANPQHAEDITQAVFIILARKAGTLGRKTVLPGWLYHTARLTAANLQRAEARRVRREQEAFMQSTLNESDLSRHSGATADTLWRELHPQLDKAMAVLGAGERDALVLRYFQNKSMAEVGQLLGLAENTAQKRVSRALEKLRQFFFKRGVSLTTAIIAGVISAHSVQAAPAALAKIVTTVALTKGAAAPISILTLIKGALKIMAWTKAKTAIVAGVAVILAAGIATPVVIHHLQAKASIFAWKRELTNADNAAYQRQTGTTPAEVAQTFFGALARGDWAEVGKYCPRGDNVEGFKKFYAGMEVISLGKPFKGRVRGQRGEYSGVWVPYEIRLKNGKIQKWQLAIRCDNPEHHWYFDGGM